MSSVVLAPSGTAADRAELARWSASFLVILGLHVLALVFGAAYRTLATEPGEALPAVLIDLAPPPAAPVADAGDRPPAEEVPEQAVPDPVAEAPPDVAQVDVPPPEPEPVVAAEIPPPEPLPNVPSLDETLKPPPVVAARAEVALPPPQAAPRPVPPRPKEKVVERKPPKPVQARRAERQVAERPPSERAGAQTTSSIPTASSGSAAARRSSWQGALVAHLRRNLRPQGGETGAASVRFSMDRGGRVLATSLVGSAGSPALDAEALAVFRRAQPLPQPPPDVPGGSFTFTIPVRFTTR